MDPVSQGALGATAALIVAGKKNHKQAALIGAAAGLAPDLDILLKSSHDPLLALELHRQFTHSLLFIPIGGLIASFLFWVLFYRRQAFKPMYWYATAGYATHGLLDACTSYGTQLLWPFSTRRIAWDTIGIIDFFVTAPLLAGVILTCMLKRQIWTYGAAIFFITYMGLGALQHHRALEAVHHLSAEQGHKAERVKVMPTIGNVIVWRTLYQANELYYINAVALPLFGQPKIYPGPAVRRLNMKDDFSRIRRQSTQRADVERFRWFTGNWLAVHPQQPDVIADLRYSLQVEGIKPLWGIRLDPAKQNQHVEFTRSITDGDRDLIPLDKIFN